MFLHYKAIYTSHKSFLKNELKLFKSNSILLALSFVIQIYCIILN
jgi:hypothetical protein